MTKKKKKKGKLKTDGKRLLKKYLSLLITIKYIQEVVNYIFFCNKEKLWLGSRKQGGSVVEVGCFIQHEESKW